MLKTGASRVLLVGFLRNGAVLNVKISMMAVHRALHPGTPISENEKYAVFAVIVNILAQLTTFKYMYELHQFSQWAMGSVQQLIHNFAKEGKSHHDLTSKVVEWDDMLDHAARTRWMLRAAAMGTLLVLLML